MKEETDEKKSIKTYKITYQIIQNIGMTMALIPVTGVTLPFISYGASSLVSSMQL